MDQVHEHHIRLQSYLQFVIALCLGLIVVLLAVQMFSGHLATRAQKAALFDAAQDLRPPPGATTVVLYGSVDGTGMWAPVAVDSGGRLKFAP